MVWSCQICSDSSSQSTMFSLHKNCYVRSAGPLRDALKLILVSISFGTGTAAVATHFRKLVTGSSSESILAPKAYVANSTKNEISKLWLISALLIGKDLGIQWEVIERKDVEERE